MGRRLPHKLLMYAFGADLGGQAVLDDAQALAKQSGIPMRNLTLVNRHSDLLAQRPERRLPEERLLLGADPVPA